MKLQALRLHNVRRFAGRGVAIEGIAAGVNVLCAANEHGKSTSFEALHALFFQPHTGTAKDIRRLQPYSGGNPLVEADIEVDGGRYRLRKRFLGQRLASVTELASGRLVAQADEAERFIGELVRGGAAGPAGLLWVRQGLTGLEEGSRREVDEERRVRESLLTSVQGEVEAITGGRRMSRIIEACMAELGLIATATLRPKTGGPYAAALDDRARYEAEERRLFAEVTALREALDARARAQKRIAELERPEERQALRSAAVAAEAALADAKAHGAALAALEAETVFARGRHDTAERELQRYRAALERARDLDRELADAEAAAGAARTRRGEAQAALDAAQAASRQAEERESEARALLGRLDAALAARQAAQERETLRARLDQAEAARTALERVEAALAAVALPAEALDRLQAQELAVARLEAAEEAALPTLRIDYLAGAPRISLDGVVLEADGERPVRDGQALELPGIGRLTLRSGQPVKASERLAAERETLRAMLAKLGVDSIAAARRRQETARSHAGERDGLRAQLALLAPDGLPALRTAMARLDDAAAPAALELKEDPQAARAAHAAAQQLLAETRNAAREVQPLLARQGDALLAAETAAARLRGERERLSFELGQAEERAGREAALAAAARESSARRDEAEAKHAEAQAKAPDLRSVEAAFERARSALAGTEQEIARLGVTLAELNGQIRTRSDDAVEEAWREAGEQRAAAQARVAAYETELAVLGRLRDVLQASRSAARDLYLAPVLAELQPLLGLLFDDVAIDFDENTLLPRAIRRNGQEEEIDRLSGGMREQLSILTRLAFARLLAREGRAAPVILDDALVYSDDDRIERMFDALHRQAREQQIIVFSCRQRAFSRLGGTVLAMSGWEPQL